MSSGFSALVLRIRRFVTHPEELERRVVLAQDLITGLAQKAVDRFLAADLGDHDVGGGVVAGDDHLGDDVPERGIQAGIVESEDAGPAAIVGLFDDVALVQVQLALIGQAVGEHHGGELDGAGAFELIVGANAGFFAGAQMLDVDARPRGKPR